MWHLDDSYFKFFIKSKVKVNDVEMEWPLLKFSYSMVEMVTRLNGRVPYENNEKERMLLNSICTVEDMIRE